ncbi:MAG TPA: hypothetical protein VFM02_00990 [Candidatus Paceibacterota bacterium]|nr:hypothetical protein [Candidatus Paceibacterota bacterium]
MKNSIRQIALVLFLVCMLSCAVLALLGMWGAFGRGIDSLPPIIPSLFIVGLASFLIWIVVVIHEIRERILKGGKPKDD